jgi:outer membrane protein assembly factor BamB
MRCLLLILPLTLAAADPAMFRGGPAHTGVYPTTSAPTLSSVVWKFKTRGKVFSSPAVADGSVYIGSTDGRLYAIDSATGSERWHFQTKGPVNSSPAVTQGRVYFASVDGNFYAVDAATGKESWKFATQGEQRFTAPGIHGITPRTETMPDPFDTFLSSPAIVNGSIYFGSGDHNIYALDALSGKLRWKFQTGNVTHASPAVSEGVVYIGSWDRYFYALDARTGKQIWRFETGDDRDIYNQVGIASSAAVADNTVYFGCRDSQFYALDAKTGKLKWQHDNHGGWVIASPAVENGVVYFPTSDGARFKALAATDGKVLYDVSNKDVSFSSPALSGGLAWYGTADGWLHAIDAKTGRVKYEFQTDGNKENASRYLTAEGKPDGPRIFLDPTLDGILAGLSRVHSLGTIHSSPVISDGVVYFGSTDGNLYAVR